jgi:hypothetical protein
MKKKTIPSASTSQQPFDPVFFFFFFNKKYENTQQSQIQPRDCWADPFNLLALQAPTPQQGAHPEIQPGYQVAQTVTVSLDTIHIA